MDRRELLYSLQNQYLLEKGSRADILSGLYLSARGETALGPITAGGSRRR